MDSLVGYGSDDDVETERYGGHHSSVDHGGAPGGGGSRRRDDDTNYDDVNMDMSEDSQGAESEPELPPADNSHRPDDRESRKSSVESRDRDRDRDRDRRDRRPSPAHSRDKDRDRRSPRKDDRYRNERSSRGRHETGKRGLLGDKPDDRNTDNKVPALMDLKPFGGEPPPGLDRKSHDSRDATSPRFTDRDRRDKDRERDRDRDHRHSRRSEEKRYKQADRRERSRSRGNYAPPAHASSSSSNDRHPSPPTSDYRPSYKVNKKLEVMEKMGLQIKTPDGSMATAQQLRAAAGEPAPNRTQLPSYYNNGPMTGKILDQVQKRKLLWSNKNKNEQEEAAKWSGTRFAQDNDGKQASKFMRLMGIKDPAAVKAEADKAADPIKKQEELFSAMQAQYEVARATTHTMRGVGLGFQRSHI